jgi:hypothetical protein
VKGRIAFVVMLAVGVALLAGVASGRSQSAGSTGAGTVFLPNPVAELQNESLTDQKDADYAALQPAYHDVTLTTSTGAARSPAAGSRSSARPATRRARPPTPSGTTATTTASSR